METTLSEEGKRYVSAVTEALSDLDAADRDDLLAELEASFGDLELDSTEGIEQRLGPPQAFAAELRAAAGLPPGVEKGNREAPVSDPWLGSVVKIIEGMRDYRAFRRARAVLFELAPIWWLVRGFLVVLGLATLFGVGFSRWFLPTWPTPLGHLGNLTVGTASIAASQGEGGIALLAIATFASLVIGIVWRRRRQQLRILGGFASAATLILAVIAAVHVWNTADHVTYTPTPFAAPSFELTYEGNKVDNIYPFDRSGHLLHDVLLYTGAGQPIDIPALNHDCLLGRAKYCFAADTNRRVVWARGKLPVLNAFPIRYFEPGTRLVKHPNAIPPVSIPDITTPALQLPAAGGASSTHSTAP